MKTFKVFLAVVFATLLIPTAYANGPWNRFFQDAKMPTQAMLEHYQWLDPALSQTVLSAGAANINLPTTFSTFAAQPDFPRNIVITPTGSTGSVVAGTGVVTGTNIYGKVITENFSFTNAQSTATTGSKAFKTVTSVLFPAPNNTGVTVNVVTGIKLGIPRCMDVAGNYVFSEYEGVYETSRGTAAVNSTAVESNTFQANGTLDGAHDVDYFYVQNFRCYPN